MYDFLQIALVHLFFNISGILLWFVLPFMRVPIMLAKSLGNITAHYRWFAIFYVVSCFFFIPLLVFGLSLAGLWALLGVLIPVAVVIVFILVINFMQSRFPELLPSCLQTWDFLPLWARSLEPWDRKITFMTTRCCCCCKCCSVTAGDEESVGKKDIATEMHDNQALTNETPGKDQVQQITVILNVSAL